MCSEGTKGGRSLNHISHISLHGCMHFSVGLVAYITTNPQRSAFIQCNNDSHFRLPQCRPPSCADALKMFMQMSDADTAQQ